MNTWFYIPDGLQDYLWTPLLGRGYASIALVLLSLLVVFVIAAMCPFNVPGAVTEHERRGVAEHERQLAGAVKGLAAWLFRQVTWVVPLLLIGSTGYLFFPVRPPRTLLLVSRSRVAGADGRWGKAWEDIASTIKPAGWWGKHLDAGPAVDAVFKRLVEPETMPAGGWLADSADDLEKARKVVRAAMLDPAVVPLKIENAIDADRIVRPEAEVLPRWLRESVEISVLKSISAKENIGRIVVAAPDRMTPLGWAWSQAAPICDRRRVVASPSLRS